MDIGTEKPAIVIEPVEVPIKKDPAPEPEPAPVEVPETKPELVPA
jgi:hypothetical protein